MIKNLFYIFGGILLIITGFSTGFIISDKLENTQKNFSEVEIKNEKETIDTPLKNINNISFNPLINDEEKEIKNEEKIDIKKSTPKDIPCPTPKIEYEDMFLRAIGQDYGLADFDYTPKNLEKVNILYSTKTGICLIKEVRENFESMAQKAKDDGYIIKISSGFRDYDIQKYLLSNEIRIGNPNAEIAVAKAGHSEHQLGTAIDITGQSINYDSASNKFNKTDEAKWMEEHANEYGFVMSYPLGKENITGYQYEPWHYRYVGIDTAKEVLKSDKTLNEYLKSLKQ